MLDTGRPRKGSGKTSEETDDTHLEELQGDALELWFGQETHVNRSNQPGGTSCSAPTVQPALLAAGLAATNLCAARRYVVTDSFDVHSAGRCSDAARFSGLFQLERVRSTLDGIGNHRSPEKERETTVTEERMHP